MSAASDQRDTFAQRFKPFATTGSGVYFAGPALGYLDPVRVVPAPDPAITVQIFLSYLTDANDAGRLGESAPGVRWPGLRRPVVAGLGTQAATASDAVALLAANADASGDAERSRSRIESGTFAGIATTYAFSPSRHTGVDPREIALLAYENGRVVTARASAVPAK